MPCSTFAGNRSIAGLHVPNPVIYVAELLADGLKIRVWPGHFTTVFIFDPKVIDDVDDLLANRFRNGKATIILIVACVFAEHFRRRIVTGFVRPGCG